MFQITRFHAFKGVFFKKTLDFRPQNQNPPQNSAFKPRKYLSNLKQMNLLCEWVSYKNLAEP